MAGEAWWKRKGAPPAAGESLALAPAAPQAGLLARLTSLPRWAKILLAVLLLLIVWYGVIGTMRSGIRPDLSLRPSEVQLPVGGSVTAAMAARIIEHEVDERAFTPNDPFFFPTGFARRTPAYQARLIGTVAVAVSGLSERTEGAELRRAANSLATPPEKWWLRSTWPPIGPSAERQYRRAAEALIAHNEALGASRRGDPNSSVHSRMDPASVAALSVLADAVEAEAARGDRMLRNPSSGSISVQLAGARGTATAAALMMRGLRDDNAAAIRISGKAARWGEALDALDTAASVSPLVTREADLVTIGYSLLIAGNAMRDILQVNPS